MTRLYSLVVSRAAGVKRRLRRLHYRWLGVTFVGKAWIQDIEIPRNHGAIRIGNDVALDRGVVLLAINKKLSAPVIEIGECAYVNRSTIIDALERVYIGKNAAIGPGCYITDHDHGFNLGAPVLNQALTSAPTIIEEGAWLGAHVIVLKGVTIGRNSVVGAGSVVSRNIPPETVAIGSPARVIRKLEPFGA
jgi:acetyltransferase-like isoleucine patch superfamily enzyme